MDLDKESRESNQKKEVGKMSQKSGQADQQGCNNSNRAQQEDFVP